MTRTELIDKVIVMFAKDVEQAVADPSQWARVEKVVAFATWLHETSKATP